MKPVKKKNADNKIFRFLNFPEFLTNDFINLISLHSKLEIYSLAYNQKPAIPFPSDKEIIEPLLNTGFKKIEKALTNVPDKLKDQKMLKLYDESKKQRRMLVKGKSNKEYFERTHNLINNFNSTDLKASALMMTAIKYLIAIGQNYNQLTDQEKEKFLFYKNALIAKAHEAIGFWKAKLEEKIRNSHENKGKRNKEAIKYILEEMKITSLTVFRSNKNLKEIFLSKAKEATKINDQEHEQPLGEKTIMDYARNELAERKKITR